MQYPFVTIQDIATSHIEWHYIRNLDIRQIRVRSHINSQQGTFQLDTVAHTIKYRQEIHPNLCNMLFCIDLIASDEMFLKVTKYVHIYAQYFSILNN